jgi:hypothetical protein
MSAAAGPRALPPIAAHWVKNSVLAAAISAVASLAMFGLRHMTGVADADAGFGAAAILWLAAILLWALAGFANGVLTGAVLQRIVPLLPAWNWIALQVAIALLAGIAAAANATATPGDTPHASNLPLGATLLWGFILGGLLGAAVGGLEALVLRTVALGTSSWIVWSAAAHGLGFSLIAGGGTLWSSGTDLASELAATALWLLAAAIGALVMLPALQGLRSRALSKAGEHFT